MKATYNLDSIQPKTDRILFLDVLRGIAIQFIFIANINFFSGYYFFENAQLTLPTDRILEVLIYTLVDGKFYSIFSLLFGIGCYAQYRNTQKHNKSFPLFFAKRMTGLLAFGLIHLFGLWYGDILTLYALLGLALIPFIKLTDRRLIVLAVGLTLLPIVNEIFIHSFGYDYTTWFFETAINLYEQNGFPLIERGNRGFPDIKFYILNQNYPDFVKMTFANGFIRSGNILLEGRIFKVFAIFLLGLWAGRKIIKQQVLTNLKFLKKAFWIGMGIGLPISILRTYCKFYADNNEMWEFVYIISYAFGTVPMAIGIVAGLAILFDKKPLWFKWLAPVGKMAFTNYIMQTIICISVFYGIALGYGGILGYTLIVAMAIAVFLLQAAFSKIWLRYFNFGPLEWVWRQLSYGKRFAIRKK